MRLSTVVDVGVQGLPRALVVDADREGSMMIRSSLTGTFSSDFVFSGSEAISKAIESLPDVILIDSGLPNVDGYEVLRQIRMHPASTDTPVICMSDRGSELTRSSLVEQGVVGLLKKPLNMQSLAHDIQHLLKAANTVVESKEKKRKFTIAFHQAEKYRLMKNEILTLVGSGETCVVLSPREGPEFWAELLSSVSEEKVIYLQIQPSLIAKLPYLQDLSPVIGDLRSFLESNGERLPHLILDDPFIFFNMQDQGSAVAKFHALSHGIASSFESFRVFSTLQSSDEGLAIMSEIALDFC